MRLSVQPELQLWKPRCFWVLEGKNYASKLPLLMAVQQKSTQNWTKEEFCFKDLNQSEDKNSYFHPSSSSFPLLWTLESRTVFSICIKNWGVASMSCIFSSISWHVCIPPAVNWVWDPFSDVWGWYASNTFLNNKECFTIFSGICFSICCLWTVLICSWWDDTLSWFGNVGLNWFVSLASE